MPLTTQAAAENAIKQHSTDPFLVRLIIEHDTLAEPIRIVRNRQNIVAGGSPGVTFLAYPFTITPPSDDDEQPSAKITVANVDRSIGRALEAMIAPAEFTVEEFLASDPDTVERRWTEMSMTQASWNFQAVTLTIQRLSYWEEPWPKKRVTLARYPGLSP